VKSRADSEIWDNSDWLPESANDFDGEIVHHPDLVAVFQHDYAKNRRVLIFAVVSSLLLHFALFALPNFLSVPQSSNILKPGEQVQKVRLVEMPPPPKEEPPPTEPAAISEFDHTAKQERIPRTIPTETKGPIGVVAPPQQQKMASLPPSAPEELIEKKVEKPDKTPKEREPKVKKPTKPHPKNEDHRRATAGDMRRRTPVNLAPTAQDYAKALSPSGGSSEFFPEGDAEEAVVDINTKADGFFSYLLHIKHKIQGVWVYPQSAARSGMGGSLTVEFLIAKSGELIGLNLLDSSGHTILDESALNAIKSAGPYNPLPERMRIKRLRIRANFIYVTDNYFRRIL
jgi:periplasmic protein TonB